MKKSQLTKADLEVLQSYGTMLERLHTNFKPHGGQLKIIHAIFKDGKKFLFCQCGRRFGKTAAAIYIATRVAMLVKNAQVYVVAPLRKQASEIYWASNRLKDFPPREYLLDGKDAFSESDLRVKFKNGSFIKLDGADNVEALRGITPSLVIYDEYRDFRPGFHEAMEPALASKQAPLVIFSTPPDRSGNYTDLRDWVVSEARGSESRYYYLELPTFTNPLISADWLEEQRRQLSARGEEHVYRREYLAQYVVGGANAIFPMFDPKSHVKAPSYLEALVERDKSKLTWIVSCDPGTTTCFGVLFMAINPYTSQIFIFDEIYEKNKSKTSTSQIWGRVEEIKKKYWEGDWYTVYDAAEAWFGAELRDRYGVAGMPSRKERHNVVAGGAPHLSLIKDCMNRKGTFFISDRCEFLRWEIENYVTDGNGMAPRKDDHLIDPLRYALTTLNYRLVEEPLEVKEGGGRRLISLEEDLREERRQRGDLIEGSYYNEDTGDLWIH